MPRFNQIIATLFLGIAPMTTWAATNISPELFEKSAQEQGAAFNVDSYRVPVKADAAKLFALKPKSHLKLTLPGLDTYDVVFDEAVTYAGGVREWRGHLNGKSDLRIV